MDRSQILHALTALGRRLAARGIVGELYVVGGAAIALAFDERRATRDIDAVFEPKLIVYEEAVRVADELDLPEGWLNDGVKGFLAGPDPWPTSVLEVPGLRVQSASPEMLLALKCLAHRLGEDDDDVRLLTRHLGLTDPDDVLDLVVEVFGDQVDLRVELFVREVLRPQA
ncbi:MAG: hypothetical protein WKF86_11235 [Acidimicrobiales bacterium]